MIIHVHTYPTSGKLYMKIIIIINANVSARLCWPSSGHTRWKYKKIQLLKSDMTSSRDARRPEQSVDREAQAIEMDSW